MSFTAIQMPAAADSEVLEIECMKMVAACSKVNLDVDAIQGVMTQN